MILGGDIFIYRDDLSVMDKSPILSMVAKKGRTFYFQNSHFLLSKQSFPTYWLSLVSYHSQLCVHCLGVSLYTQHLDRMHHISVSPSIPTTGWAALLLFLLINKKAVGCVCMTGDLQMIFISTMSTPHTTLVAFFFLWETLHMNSY